jgi:hypothetical protein
VWEWLLLATGFVGGTVRSDGTLEPVAYASVEIVSANLKAMTARNGTFAIENVPSGTFIVRVSALGYASDSTSIEVRQGMNHVDIVLRPSPVELPALVSEARRRESDHVVVLGEEIRRAPRTIETDVLRSLTGVPGVQSASDFSTGLYVRGGTPDQTVIMLDGVPLLVPYHLGGALTAVAPDAVASVDVYPGGLPAQFGDRLAGYVNIWTREGARDRMHVTGGVGLASARMLMEGPLNARGSYLLAGRRTYFDLLSRAARGVGVTNSVLPYAFTDGHFKMTYPVGTWARVIASGYLDDERFHDEPTNSTRSIDARWRSYAAAARYEQTLGNGMTAGLQLSQTAFSADATYLNGVAASDSLVGDVAMRVQRIELSLGDNRLWQIGLQAERYSARSFITAAGPDISKFFPPLDLDDASVSVAGYAQYEAALSRNLTTKIGARVLHVDGRTQLLPRMNARIGLSERLALVLSGGMYAQTVATLRNEESALARVFAYDINMPLRESDPVPTSRDVTIGMRGLAPGISLGVDVYAKWVSDLALPSLPSDPQESPLLVAERFAGSARMKGVELTAAKQLAGIELSGSYAGSLQTYSVGPVTYTPSHHRKHSLSVTAGRGTHASYVSVRATLQSGLPYTPGIDALGTYRHNSSSEPPAVPAGDVVLLGPHNSARLPAYYRLDVALRRTFEKRLFGRATNLMPYLDIHNITNSRNALWGEPTARAGAPLIEYGPQLPFLPTIGVEWTF